ncbi:MAG: TadE/TadG family type IV pilus assembly protein [bacterium]
MPRATANAGQVATEFVLVLPIAIFLIVAAVAMAVLAVRGIVAQSAAARAARFAAIFEEEMAGQEFGQALGREIFSAGAIEITGSGDGPRASNEVEGILNGYAFTNGALDISSATIVYRQSPVAPALPAGLGDRALRGGDTPSPYCLREGGYSVCGFPE